jgi:hypothetical protein
LFLGYLLMFVVPIAAIAYIVWAYRKKTAQRDVESASRLHELLGAAVHVPAESQRSRRTDFEAMPAAPAPEAVPAPAVQAAAPREEAAAPLYAVRERVLSVPQTLLYYLLKTGLPDYVILARVSLAAVLEAGPGLTGFAREEQIRRLSAITVDFLVSDNRMQPVAVVELEMADEGSAARADRESARLRLAAAGVRYVEVDPRAMPRKDAIRALVLDARSEDAGRATTENVAS